MSPRRTLAVAAVDWKAAWKRPLWLMLLAIYALLAIGMVGGNVRIGSGDSNAGGAEAWINSQFNVAFLIGNLVALFAPFFAAIATGLPVLQDLDRKIDRILYGTPLRPSEHVAGRFLGATIPLLAVTGGFIAVLMLALQFWPIDNPEKQRGPFALANFLWPATLLSLPLLLAVSGGALWLGARTRSPLAVFLMPIGILILGPILLWNWSPEWLPWGWNRVLMLIDPTGVRWLNETWLKTDRGVAFYNTQPIVPDAAFAASRIAFALVGLALVPLATRSLVRGKRTRDERRLDPALLASIPPAGGASAVAPLAGRRLDGLAMETRVPGSLAAFRTVLGSELRILLRSPGVWLFTPLIALQVVGSSFASDLWLDTRPLETFGSLATSSFNTLTLLLVLLTLFYTVESMVREERLGFAPVFRATPIPTRAMLAGKIAANAGLALVVMAATMLGCLVVVAIQWASTGTLVPLEFGVFVKLWGVILTPTLLVWSAFIALVHGLVRNRYATWGIGLAVLIGTGILQLWGYLNWASNWHLWNALVWSDLDRLGFYGTSLVANRLFMLSLAAVFLVLAAAAFPRRVRDPQRTIDRTRPKPVLLGLLRLSPLVAIALGLGGWTWIESRTGFQGAVLRREARDYRKRNDATFRDAPVPALAKVDAAVEVDPATRRLWVSGTYVIRNPHAEPMTRIPFTAGRGWENLAWTLDGVPQKPVGKDDFAAPPYLEDRAGLWTFTLAEPLEGDRTVTVGFAFDATFPAGWTRNGGGVAEFILPSGVVLTSFSANFMPAVGYLDGIGVDERNAVDAKDPEPEAWKGLTPPAFGSAWAFDLRMTVTGPADWELNAVGVPGEPTIEGDRKTITWVTDHPVRFFNLAGGPLVRNDGEGSSIFHSPRHPWNIAAMTEALDASRKHYSEWFAPYPRRDLRLTEFPSLANYAQGFPGNITFSESIGFRTRNAKDDDVDLVFFVTAHEAAHQWWGNMLMPGKGPGGNVLSEGMANFSSALLTLEKRGEKSLRKMLRQWEDSYANGRVADSERPLNLTTGTRPGDTTVTYDKGGWAFWMLLEHMGRERNLAGIREFIATFRDGPDYPLIEDFLAVMRKHAADPEAFDAFTTQWFLRVAVPEFRFSDATVIGGDGSWRVAATVENVGTGTVELEIAAEGETPEAPEGEDAPAPPRSIARVTLAAGERKAFEVSCGFPPKRLVADPDVRVLQLRRKLAELTLPKATVAARP